MTGYLFFLRGALISWCSKRQIMQALSTMEAEAQAICTAVYEALWLRKLPTDLGHPPKGPTVIFTDSRSAITSLEEPRYHS